MCMLSRTLCGFYKWKHISKEFNVAINRKVMDVYKWLNMCALQHSGPHITLVMSSSSPSIHTLETLRSDVEK